jgi:hypothetical protein
MIDHVHGKAILPIDIGTDVGAHMVIWNWRDSNNYKYSCFFFRQCVSGSMTLAVECAAEVMVRDRLV